jgi:hypothetical protein
MNNKILLILVACLLSVQESFTLKTTTNYRSKQSCSCSVVTANRDYCCSCKTKATCTAKKCKCRSCSCNAQPARAVKRYYHQR